MKIMVSIIGISHAEGTAADARDGRSRAARTRLYDCCPDNINKMLIEPLRKNHDVDIALVTYPHQHIAELQDMYNPRAVNLVEWNGSYMQKTYSYALRWAMVRNDPPDVMMTTRFDILFGSDMSALPYDWSKFNVLFEEKGYPGQYTCDNFYVSPFSMCGTFADAIDGVYAGGDHNGLHPAAYEMSRRIGRDNLNIIDPEPQLGHNNRYYTLPHA